MHEMSLAQNIFEILGDQLGGKRTLLTVTVTIGPLAGIAPDALSFAVPEVAETMGFGRPELIVCEDPGRASCADCGAAYALQDAFAVCPECGSIARHIEGGDRFTLDSVEIAGEDDGAEINKNQRAGPVEE